ncbi:hypothetical protein DCAR_0310699 [Daucus carota subsp. sativus]|uniref:F-box domain-containing protein n=1 Tax=Daucus carota subsp. sativus TaxID=79200 RepID=A0AAF0WNW4_DAUCS|nr:hypothetical protein DCAR_0310699 [Daucus carota subsp. sativus]
MTSEYASNAEMLTEDLITDILVRLPVKSLLRCKSVSKPWFSLISSPNFTKYQLKHTLSKPGADRTLILKIDDDFISLLSLNPPQLNAPFAFPYTIGHFRIVGSCNGIVCVSAPRTFCYFPWYRRTHDIYLWNPATRQSKLIPPNIRDDIPSRAVGFGFDSVHNDYKVMRVASSFAEPFSAEVYSANADVWRKLDPMRSDYPEYGDFDVCVNGFLCCQGFYGMMALDLSTEVIASGIRLPHGSDKYSCITDFNDSIAIITYNKDELNPVIKLRTLDDEACLRGDGVEACWTLRLSIHVDLAGSSLSRVYGCFSTGDFMLGTEDTQDSVLLYNSHNKEATNVPCSIYFGRRIIKYHESLVSVNDPN